MTQATMTSLAEAAAQTLLTEVPVPLPAPENRQFIALVSEPERNPFRGWNPAGATIQSYVIPHAVLDGAFRGIITDAGFVRGSQYLTPDHILETLRIDPDRLIRNPQDDGPVIVGCNSSYRNYFHWMTQALPAIDHAMRREGQARNPRIALPPLTPWQADSLQLLGYDASRRLPIDDPTRQYGFSRIEHNDVLTGATAFTLSASVAATYRRLQQAVEQSPPARRKLYVARTDAPARKMRNEAEVVDGMAKRGFEILEAGTRSVAEQIAIFRDADLVVGPHGAGLTNIVFCRPGTIVYELVHGQYTNSCFCNLAYLMRLQYWADVFRDPEDPSIPENLRDWQSHTDVVLARVDELEQIMHRQHEAARRLPISAMDFLRGKEGVLAAPQAPAAAEADPSPAGFRGWLRRLGRRRG